MSDTPTPGDSSRGFVELAVKHWKLIVGLALAAAAALVLWKIYGALAALFTGAASTTIVTKLLKAEKDAEAEKRQVTQAEAESLAKVSEEEHQVHRKEQDQNLDDADVIRHEVQTSSTPDQVEAGLDMDIAKADQLLEEED